MCLGYFENDLAVVIVFLGDSVFIFEIDEKKTIKYGNVIH
jgi:hypothetical protein